MLILENAFISSYDGTGIFIVFLGKKFRYEVSENVISFARVLIFVIASQKLETTSHMPLPRKHLYYNKMF